MFRRTAMSVMALFAAAPLVSVSVHAADVKPLAKGDRVVFLGDSITQAGARPGGYVSLVAEDIKAAHPDLDVAVIGAGISGNKVPDLQKRLDRDVIAKKPTVVVIYIGINDVWHSVRGKGTNKADFEAGLHDIIKRINAAGARVILATPSVIGEKTDGSNKLDSMLDEYAAISRKVAAETDSQLLDLRKAFMDHLKANNPDNKEKGILTGDQVHLNKAGNRFVADQMLGALGVTPADSGAAKGGALAFKMKTLEGQDVDLAEKYKGKVVLMVNVASKCGLTPQYTQLQQLHETFADKGLAVVGFPCNQFGKQEPGSPIEIAQFCEKNYGVEFDLMSKIDVNGDDAHPLYKYLTKQAPNVEHGDIKWNFEKFLVDRHGNVVARFSPRTKPDDKQVVAAIEKLLAE